MWSCSGGQGCAVAACGAESHCVAPVACRCSQLEAQLQQLHTEASEARGQLTSLVKAHEQLRAETDKRVAAAKQSAAAERDTLQARHTAKVKKLQEAAKDQVSLRDGNLGGGGIVTRRHVAHNKSGNGQDCSVQN